MPFSAKSAMPLSKDPAAGHQVFDEAARGGHTLLTVPPAFLLTEGLSAALRRQRERVVWVRLGPEDRDPGVLLESLIAAARRWRPEFGSQTVDLMQGQPDPVAGWPAVFGRLAEELHELLAPPSALVLQHVHHLRRAHPTLELLGAGLLRPLADRTTCVLTSSHDLPAAALLPWVDRRLARDLRLGDAAVSRVLERGAPELLHERLRQTIKLCQGRAAVLAAVCAAWVALGPTAVEDAIDQSTDGQRLLELLAGAWLTRMDIDGRQALGLLLGIGYGHPALSTVALGAGQLPSGPWLQGLGDGWVRARTVWRAPLRSILAAQGLPGRGATHRAADYLLERGAVEQAVHLYFELKDPACAARAVAAEADRLMDLGQWQTVGEWFDRLPAGRTDLAGAQACALEAERLSDQLQAIRRSRDHHYKAYLHLKAAERTAEERLLAQVGSAHRQVTPAGRAGAGQAPLLTAHLLGRWRVALNGASVDDWPSGRGRALLAYLLTHRDPWPPREVLMEAFWPGAAPAAARNRLNVAIHGLRRALRAAADVPVVVLERGAYRLHPGLELWVDVDELHHRLRTGRQLEAAGELAGAMAEHELTVSLYQGDFLADNLYEEWTIFTRERLRLAYLGAVDSLSHLYFGHGRYAACVAMCQRVIERDPCREDAQRRLMRCYSRQGQPHLALRQYRTCVEALSAELGVEPAAETAALFEQIRRREPV